MKFINLRVVLLVFAITLILVSNENSKKWCWTLNMANEASFKLDQSRGGINWGYCKTTEVARPINYLVEVETSTLKSSETLYKYFVNKRSTVKIKLFGDKGESNISILSDSGFERGSFKKINVKSVDVGNIQKIIIYVEGSQDYRCKQIAIISGPKRYNFECIKFLKPCSPGEINEKCSEEIVVDGTIPYEITVKTSDDDGFGTNSPVLFNLIGTKGYSQTKLLSDTGFLTSSSKTRHAYITDIGELTGFKLILSGHGKWKPVSVMIVNKVTNKINNFPLTNIVLMNPGKDSYILDSSIKKEENSEEEDKSKEDSLDINNPEGGLIDFAEKKRKIILKKDIINLKCYDTLINPDQNNLIFGPDFPTKFVNYMNILAKCPNDCHKSKGKVYGVGIHPMQSPICLSAIVDKALSYFGGIISISIYTGLDKYSLPKGFDSIFDGITVVSYPGSKKSYTVSKVDNVDLVEKDIRILNSKGQLSNKGRVELRKEGEWGTICSIGNNRLSARRICIDLGYKDGEWLSSNVADESKDFCKSFNGGDYCGAVIQPVHFWRVECEITDTHLNQCHKIYANLNECSHNYDAIINCYNTNFEAEPTIPQGVVRLDNADKIGLKTIGRLEIYTSKEFLPVCFLKFNEKSAEIACKQMGYENGEISPDEFAERFRLPASSTVNFSASEVECKGTENNIQECKKISSKIICKHSQDVVVICSNGNGDYTGKSQYITAPISSPPLLSKLGLKKQFIKCDESANSVKFRGDPGSLHLVTCDKNCGNIKGSIWGTGIFTSNSNICKAAIHAGIIENNLGGTFALTKIWGSQHYFGNDINGIKSYEHFGNWEVSFVLSKTNSGWENMYKLHQGLLGSFLEISNNFSIKNDKFSSFIESNNNNELFIPKPIYQWFPRDFAFNFSDSSNIVEEKNNLSALNIFSLLVQFTMKDFKNKKQYIFSYKSCLGLNVLIDETGNLLIGDLCNNNRWVKTNIMVPLNDKILLFLKYIKGNLTMIYKSNLNKIPIERTFTVNMEVNGLGPVGIGRFSTENIDHFYGSIEFVQLYDIEIDKLLIDKIIASLDSNKGAKFSEKTEDNRNCVKSCTDNPLPGTPGASEPPAETSSKSNSPVEIPNILKGEDKDKTNKNNDNSGKSDSVKNDFGTYDKREESNIESIDLECDTNLLDNRFDGSEGKIFRVKCKNCSAEKGIVFGSYIFHPLSSICKSALHVGIFSKNKPSGDIVVEIEKGKSMYNGSSGRDGSYSASMGKSLRSFKVKKAAPLTKISCFTSADKDVFSQAAIGAKFVVLCPQNCSKIKNGIYGTEIYTDNSPMCLAAIHYGILTDKGGELEFIIENGLSDYRGTKGFGVESKSKGPHVRSFRFLGIRSGIFYNFKEDYIGKLSKKWKINVNKQSKLKINNYWKYLIATKKTVNGIVENIQSIEHKGTISVNGELKYSTWISLKNAEFANGIVKFNMKLNDDNPVAVLFRYNNNDNYFGVEFNMKSSNGNIKLTRNIEGLSSVIDSKTVKFIQDKWYRWQLILNFDKIKLILQQDKIREHKIIFSRELLGISRGGLAFATNGNNNFLVNGIEINEYNENNKKTFDNNKRSWSKLLEKLSNKERKLYCRDTFDHDQIEISRCMEIHNFCKIRCDEIVAVEENILNFTCFKDCVKTSNIKESKKEGLSLSSIIKGQQWIPKANDKCDYRPIGNGNFLIGVVKKIQKIENYYKVFVSYRDDDTNLTSEVKYPSNDLTECGKSLSKRNDCKISEVLKKRNKK